MWAQTLNTAPKMVGVGNQDCKHAAGADSAVVSSLGALGWASSLEPPGAGFSPTLLSPASTWGLPLSQAPLSLHSMNLCFVLLFFVSLKSPNRAGARRPGKSSYKGHLDSPGSPFNPVLFQGILRPRRPPASALRQAQLRTALWTKTAHDPQPLRP